MYDWGVFKSQQYNFPLITVGNISAGGTGKSPFVGYLVSLLQKDNKLATLSRGYGRETSGFQIVKTESEAINVGDEPLQLKQNYPATQVVVDADRRNGIKQLMRAPVKPEVIILDDAFQHRKVQGGFQIVLTAYYNLYINDYPLPAGDLREPISAAARAQVIVVTKCPVDLSEESQKEIAEKLKPLPNQKVYFTAIAYDAFVYNNKSKKQLLDFIKDSFCLVTGIAEPKPLLNYLDKQNATYTHLNYPDHHVFSTKEIEQIAAHKMILTTQKDYMRLQNEASLKGKLYYLPIGVQFLANEAEFKEQLSNFVK